jgi:hypothetical protein
MYVGSAIDAVVSERLAGRCYDTATTEAVLVDLISR